MDQTEARALAEAKLREIEDPASPLRLIDGVEPQEYEWAWTFLFNSAAYLDTRDVTLSVFSGPLVVNKDGSAVWLAPSAPPVELWLNKYAEQNGYPPVEQPEVSSHQHGG
jgi:hypothetical protein